MLGLLSVVNCPVAGFTNVSVHVLPPEGVMAERGVVMWEPMSSAACCRAARRAGSLKNPLVSKRKSSWIVRAGTSRASSSSSLSTCARCFFERKFLRAGVRYADEWEGPARHNDLGCRGKVLGPFGLVPTPLLARRRSRREPLAWRISRPDLNKSHGNPVRFPAWQARSVRGREACPMPDQKQRTNVKMNRSAGSSVPSAARPARRGALPTTPPARVTEHRGKSTRGMSKF